MNYVNKLDSNKRKIYFHFISKKNSIKNLFFSKKKNQHLFILSPPFCGSTLLTEIISTSKNLSCNNNIGLREGQHLPETKNLLFTNDKWDPTKNIDWKKIHKIWDKYWDKSKKILLEKSPPNICRALDIQKEFKNANFICLIRNPYAQVEGILRRNNTDPEYAANFALQCLEYQKKNIEQLENVILISYEELTKKHMDIKKILVSFLPELSDINTNKRFSAHNIRGKRNMKITNLNAEKINKIKKNHLEIINTTFKQKSNLLNYFKYKILN